MEAPCKRRRGNGGDATGCLSGDRDRLSELPDSLLLEIMSHMKGRQVVQTCVLARRWRNLWRSMTCLDVDRNEFATAGTSIYSDHDGWERLEDFMDTLLCPGNVSIALLDTLRLNASYGPYYGPGCEDRRTASRWIRRGIKYPHAGREPGLQRGALSRNSWHLRRLQLSSLYLCNLFAEHVRTSCLSLEDLELKCCNCDFPAIASRSLKNLVLKCCTMKGFREITSPALKNLFINGGGNTKDCLLVITAPAVASMFLGVTPYNFHGGLSLGEMPSLAKATVDLWDNNKTLVDRFRNLGGGVSSVITNLEVSSDILQVLEEGSTTFPQFNNLRTLVLKNCDLSDDFQTLGHFLRNSPNLERLTLRCCKYSNDTKKKKGSSKSKNAEPTPSPNLVDVPCKNLKLAEIIYKEDDIRYLIEIFLRISRDLPNNCIKLTKVV